jgi:hypothetical protein
MYKIQERKAHEVNSFKMPLVNSKSFGIERLRTYYFKF